MTNLILVLVIVFRYDNYHCPKIRALNCLSALLVWWQVGAITFLRAEPGFCYVIQDPTGRLSTGIGFCVCRGGEIFKRFVDMQHYARTTYQRFECVDLVCALSDTMFSHSFEWGDFVRGLMSIRIDGSST